MLKLTADQLRKQIINTSRKPIWVDIGGGTEQFEKVYLVDLCTPLCKIAESIFNAKGWNNVYVVCDDAASFKLLKMEDDIGKIDW
ncbi:37384_t:CDS:2 [Gigaspora margarita]|uniref:37384_t:CDS:1 n=1 Tax=Gigaspora margarita TaxID=4874 RepID=A0ABN7UJ53_GIGMA|nr:37384_t:CDS:2 [Gigaspora margarita]